MKHRYVEEGHAANNNDLNINRLRNPWTISKMMQIMETKEENLIAAKVNGKITKKDIEKIHPLIHNIIGKYHKV